MCCVWHRFRICHNNVKITKHTKMGRSKFPGKPSKHVNRKRINVLPAPTNAATVEHSTVTVGSDTNEEPKQTAAENGKPKQSSVYNTEVSVCKRRKRTTNSINTKRNLVSSRSLKSTMKSKPTRKSVRDFSTGRNLPKVSKEANNLVGKFVLPTRSVHSSRVIKPNKRFINVELSDSRTFKKRVINKRHSIKSDDAKLKMRLSKSPDMDTQSSCTNGRVVLRQARLQLHTQTPVGPEGPFSSNSSSTSSPPGTVTCGVCGAVRFYRFVKQARKFNIYSCESCRKFISKMIKRLKNLSSTLVCHKGQGMCHVPPIVRSQQWRLIRCAYGARCPACWLKMCLRSFQMPMALKNNLAQLLPKYMQGSELLFNSSLPLLSWQASTEKSDKQNVKIASDVKRQKIDLKGPRVKHVCRSASIVLGQPLATFPTTEPDVKSPKDTDTDSLLTDDVSDDTEISSSKDNFKPLPRSEPATKKEKIQKQSSVEVSLNVGKPSAAPKKPCEPQNLISIDFWENYDPEEVCRSGFGLIASEPFPMSAICFLCGSVGREKLVHCSLCCEPYHPYCLDPSPSCPMDGSQKFSWLCPRCTTCNQCNEPGRSKINCQKCHRDYHPECFNKWCSNDNSRVCANCLRCRNCGSHNIAKTVGNIPFCSMCFKSRKKVFCPLCRDNCTEDDAKMMECGKCKQWLHSTCERLSDEQYHLLSLLPESVEFLCSACSTDSTPLWRKAVSAELRSCFNTVLRSLSKNSTARNILKWSPLSNPTSNSQPATAIRRLQFCDGNADVSPTELESEAPVEFVASPSLKDVKSKLHANEYSSVAGFNREMETVVRSTRSEEVLEIYRGVLRKVFPWYDPTVVEKFSPESLQNEPSDEFTGELNSGDGLGGLDTRTCVLCKGLGDGLSYVEGRLLYCGQNEWVHANCALWSSEVYEEIDGSLQNVHNAVNRGRLIRCASCKLRGASVGCCYKGCFETYHFGCARNADCVFLHDKTVYCPAHDLSWNNNPVVVPFEFGIKRSVYVELDRKKKKNVEIEKVHFMVGSLSVTNLGKIIPALSDHTEAIVPSGFVCSRLFWSTTEPWKLVSYIVTTSVQSPQGNTIFLDKNFTVDHSLPKSTVERKLKEICVWHKDLTKKSEPVDEEDEYPQNAADLLSPELTDAILEELPHDLLDGISMQDIFPKLMSYEDLLNVDFKSAEVSSKIINDGMADVEDEETCQKPGRELKRSKSEFIPQLNTNSKLGKGRSCSLTLSYKFDSSLPAIKKRKANQRDNMFFHLLQVDGAYDSGSECSDCSSPVEKIEDTWNLKAQEEPVTCERCHCTYRTHASYSRHLEACEVISTSDSESECVQEDEEVKNESFVVTSFETYSTYSETHASVSENTGVYVETRQMVEQKNVIPQQPELKTLQPNFCVNQTIPLCVPSHTVEPPIAVNNSIPISFAQNVPMAPLELQTIPYTQDTISLAPQNQITMRPLVAQTVVPKPTFLPQKAVKVRPKQRSLVSKRPRVQNPVIIPQGNSMIVQHVPNFVDQFQQQPQYLATIAPQMNQPPVIQLQPDGNFISLVQPTVVIQQPRVVTDQIILDSHGSLTWATQPIYYGFETIVQNTVMQSQQFLPTTVPGVLTANSSYSTTTQVFQSKLEPVLDVAANSFVLFNSGQLVNQPVVVPPPTTILPVPPQIEKPKPVIHARSCPPLKKTVPAMTSMTTNSINLPTAPFVSEQGIPTIVVTPTPKLPPTSTQVRPMSRVLPIQSAPKEIKRVEKEAVVEATVPDNKESLLMKEFMRPVKQDACCDQSLKLVFQKQNPEGVYKISNNFSKTCNSVQVVPLKPIKSKPQPVSEPKLTPDVVKLPPEPPAPEKPEATFNSSAILYTIESQDGFRYSSTSISELWTKVFEAVQSARAAHNMPPLPTNTFKVINNLQLLGLKTNGLKYLIEQLPGAANCSKYKPSFYSVNSYMDQEDDFLMGHTLGAVRCAPYAERSESNDMFGWLASKHRKIENSLVNNELLPRRASVTNLPMAMRFRQLKLTSKKSVGVYRSNIHRRGLFCLRDIEAGEMVIEYAGEVIRSVLTDKRERYYNSKGIGCYMFRIDDNLVVDATMKGNAARFINHSCDPNCYSKVVEIHGHKHIIIFALRRIICGEELTYDYKFPFEEDKIPCTCGARRCRKFLN